MDSTNTMSSEKPKSKKKTKSDKAPRPQKSSRGPKVSPRPLVLVTGEGRLLRETVSALLAGPYDLAVIQSKDAASEDEIPSSVKRFVRPDKRAHLVIDVTLADRAEKQRSLRALDRTYGPETLILTNAIAIPITEQASWISGKHRLLGAGFLPGFIDRPMIEIAPSAMTLTSTVNAARVFFASIGKTPEIVQDRAGLVSARIICQIINEAAFALQDDIAGPEDIDTSMKLGVSYPHGPFEWAEKIGIDTVVAVLHALHAEYQEERYRVAPLLNRMALGGVWWTSPTTSAHVGEAS